MRLLLADENFLIPSVRELRAKGYDIYAVAESDSSITDEQVIEKAITEERIILTFDKDFGELIFKKGYRPPAGIIFFRWVHYAPDEPGKFLSQILQDTSLFFSYRITVVDERNIRQRNYHS
ncbi:MAG TPA: DUF5615 family PIN-like protein [Saprospiraceae bacterium]|nr:DUF5615 family PIN-like protein [Saprospiraceae bacterium]HMP26347.1 DUF5615 family PIN-like protein [Saprospiraceae bacterium]